MSKRGLSYRFDEWEDAVDCNDCEHYLTNRCDGVAEGSTKPCKAFLAARKVLFPERLEAIEEALKWLSVGLLIIGIVAIGTTIAVMLK